MGLGRHQRAHHIAKQSQIASGVPKRITTSALDDGSDPSELNNGSGKP
jgi:hypothetical protein